MIYYEYIIYINDYKKVYEYFDKVKNYKFAID